MFKKKKAFKYINEDKFNQNMQNKYSERSFMMSKIYEESSRIHNHKKMKKV